MISTKIFKAERRLLFAHTPLEGVVSKAARFVNHIGEERVFQITQGALSQQGGTSIVVWYRSDEDSGGSPVGGPVSKK